MTRRFAAAISNDVEGVATGGDDGASWVQAALDRPLVVVSQTCHPPSSECTPCTFVSRWHGSNPRTRRTPCHPAHNSSWCSNRKSCSHPAFRPESILQNGNKKLSACLETDYGVQRHPKCLHEHESDEAPMQSRSSWHSHGSSCVDDDDDDDDDDGSALRSACRPASK